MSRSPSSEGLGGLPTNLSGLMAGAGPLVAGAPTRMAVAVGSVQPHLMHAARRLALRGHGSPSVN